MRQLVLAFYGEGPTDERFLPVVIQRTAEQLLPDVDVLDLLILEPQRTLGKKESKRAELIYQAALDAAGSHALLIHSDADYPTSDRAYEERFKPGYDLVQEQKQKRLGDRLCTSLIPIIPIQMVEAWMLSDIETLRNILGTNLTTQDLGLPSGAREVERPSNPKQLLSEVVRQIYADRPHRSSRKDGQLGRLYEPLARQIRLAKLEQVPSYQKFVEDLTTTLRTLRFIGT
jgi:hypothetical protein